MKITIQVKAGDHEFKCDGDENILYAGLRNGVGLPYECATGTCGTCKARVIEGETDTPWTDAPGLAYTKADRNEILMCQTAPRGDCILKVPAKLSATTALAPAHRKGTIANVEALTHDVVAFSLDLDQPMDFEAGQFVVLSASGVTGGRAYSMTNYAIDARRLDFVVKKKPDGKFSDWLFDGDVDGSALQVFGPLGRATFDPDEDKNVLCIGGGSGIAGMMSIVSRAAEENYFNDHTGDVFFGVRTADDVFFLKQLSAFAEAFPDNLKITVALSDTDATPALSASYPRLEFATGFVHEVTAARMAGRFDNTVAYMGGPPPMIDGALRMLIMDAGMAGTDVRYDKFS